MKMRTTPSTIVAYSVEFGLRLIGCWPDSRYVTLHRFLWMLSIGVIETLHSWYFIVHFRFIDLSHLMDVVSVILVYALTLIKLISFWLNRRTFYDVLREMARDWKECETDSNMDTMASTAAISRRCSNLIISVYGFAVIFYCTGSIALQWTSNEEINEVDVAASRELLYQLELPFDGTKSPVYEFIVITQFLHKVATASIVGVLNALILTLILHVGGQVDIMCQMLADLSSKQSQSIIRLRTRDLIRRHQRIIAFSDSIENIFSQIALWQFVANTVSLCTIGYQIVSSMSTDDWIANLLKSLCFYAAITLEAFIFCFAGEYITVKGRAIGDAAYESLWYDLRPRESTTLLLIIMRSQKHLTLTIGKFMDLSLQRFTTIMKASVSYISVLRAVY